MVSRFCRQHSTSRRLPGYGRKNCPAGGGLFLPAVNHADSYSYRHADSEFNANGDPHCNSVSNSHCYADSDINAKCDSISNSNPDSDRYANCNTDSKTYADTKVSSDPKASPNSSSLSSGRFYAIRYVSSRNGRRGDSSTPKAFASQARWRDGCGLAASYLCLRRILSQSVRALHGESSTGLAFSEKPIHRLPSKHEIKYQSYEKQNQFSVCLP